jgi:hypothetical protein
MPRVAPPNDAKGTGKLAKHASQIKTALTQIKGRTEAMKKKPKRFRNITLALREIVKAQRNTAFCMLSGPFRTLFRQSVQRYKSDTWTTALAVKYVHQLVQDKAVEVFKEALKRRVEKTSAKDKLKQIAVTVDGIHIKNSFDSETKYLRGDFANEYAEALIDAKKMLSL